jgi:hypothetical protein
VTNIGVVPAAYTPKRADGRVYGWSANVAARLSGVPVRTVYHWRGNRFVAPSIFAPGHGVDAPLYCLLDVLALRLAYDFRQMKVPTSIIAATLPTFRWSGWPPDDHATFHPDVRKLAARGTWWMTVATDEDGFDAAHDVIFYTRHEPEIEAGDPIVAYPLSSVAAGLVVNADAWRVRTRVVASLVAPWL